MDLSADWALLVLIAIGRFVARLLTVTGRGKGFVMSEASKRIRLSVENAGGVGRKSWPITQGVPFAGGGLGCVSPILIKN